MQLDYKQIQIKTNYFLIIIIHEISNISFYKISISFSTLCHICPNLRTYFFLQLMEIRLLQFLQYLLVSMYPKAVFEDVVL